MGISTRTTKITVAFLALAAALGLQTQAQPILTNGLVAYFPFNGNAQDASGNSNNGVVMGGATFGTDRFGNINSCLSVPGGEGGSTGVEISSLSAMPFAPVTYSARCR